MKRVDHHVPSRRKFLRCGSVTAAAALAAPYIVPASALGRDGKAAPSDRLVMGCIGTGGQGVGNMRRFLGEPDVQVVAVCDVDQRHRERAAAIANEHNKNQDCAQTGDFREICARDDIDIVTVCTPDHWHALATIAAVTSGKDVYCEKPLANSVGEGRAICQAASQSKRIVQTGSHERSNSNARFACELVRNQRIGELKTIKVNMPCEQQHHQKVRALTTMPPPEEVPEGFDYDMWLGHTAYVPYTPLRCHFWWRFVLAYGGGEMTDRGAHIIDLAQLGAGMDHTGPVHFEAMGVASKTSLYDAFFDYRFVNTYANGVKLIGDTAGPRGVRFEGTDGWVFIHVHGGKLETEPASLLQEEIGTDDIQLGRSPGHQRNFVDAVKSRGEPMAPAEVGHRTASICHLNNLAMGLGRALTWDPDTEQVADDDDANRLLTPDMRDPWTL